MSLNKKSTFYMPNIYIIEKMRNIGLPYFKKYKDQFSWVIDPLFIRSSFNENGEKYLNQSLCGYKPCAKFSNIKDECGKIEKIYGNYFITYGETVSVPTGELEGYKLEEMYRSNCLLTTGKVYEIDNRICKEYYYKDSKFIRVFELPEVYDSIKWYEVEPIKWVVYDSLDAVLPCFNIFQDLTLDEVKKIQSEDVENRIKPSDLKNLHREDTSIDTLEEKVTRAIPFYNVNALNYKSSKYLSDFTNITTSFYGDAGRINEYKSRLNELLSFINKDKGKNATEYKMLNLINEWLYLLETDPHGVKYENLISKVIIEYKKALDRELVPQCNIKNLLLNCKEEALAKIHMNTNMSFNSVSELENIVTEHFKQALGDKFYDLSVINEFTPINDSSQNSSNNEIQSIIDEIVAFAEDTPNREEIRNKVKSLVQDYLEKQERPQTKGLSLDYVDMDREYATLKFELNQILDSIKFYKEANQKYSDMLSLVDNWEKILTGHIVNSDDSISNSLITLNNTVLPYLNDDLTIDDNKTPNQYRQKLLDILEEEKDRINEFIKSGNTNGYKDLEAFELNFRTRYQEYLLEIIESIRNKDYVSDINSIYNSLINGEVRKTKNKYIAFYSRELKKVFDYIRINGEPEDVNKANKIALMPPDNNQNMKEALRDVEERFNKLYKIKLDIDERIKRESEKNKHKLNINI